MKEVRLMLDSLATRLVSSTMETISRITSRLELDYATVLS
jgi:hypothetical protein